MCVATYEAISSYDANGNLVSGAGRNVTWSSFNIPSQISNQTPNGIKTAGFWYNPEHERTKELQADQSIVITLSPRYDTGLHFEKKYIAANGQLTGAVEYEHYLYAGGMMFGKFITTTATDGVTLATTAMEYYTKDNLGSIVAITDGTGAVTQRLSYDVWGKRRYPNGAADPNGLLNNPDMYHGFTGHEMLDSVGLIHMNGRLYDPVMARFVSADFMIQSPDDLQSYNRYSYVWNNPLGRTDPSGQCWGPTCWIQRPLASLGSGVASVWRSAWRSDVGQGAIQITIATYGGPGAVAAYNAAYTKYQGGSWNDAIKAAAISYGTVMAFNAVGTATGGHNPGSDFFGSANYYANVAGHAFVGCASAAAGGGDCGSGAMSAGFGAAAAPFTIGLGLEGGTAASAIIGGTASVLGGGRFANGAVTGAFGYLYNSQGGDLGNQPESSSLLQYIFPAHTASFSRDPIGGSMTEQIKYANTVNLIRIEAVSTSVYLGPKFIDTVITNVVIKPAANVISNSNTLPVSKN